MSIEGRINVDALFHDKDGTTSLKVVSLRSSDEYTTGKVLLITGTCATTQIQLQSAYRDASGELINLDQVNIKRAIFRASHMACLINVEDDGHILWSDQNQVAATDFVAYAGELFVKAANSTPISTYSVVLYAQ